jgi:hypothetical protein
MDSLFGSPLWHKPKQTGVILPFPARGPFAVRVECESDGDEWLVLARNHGWLHGDRCAALRDAYQIARGFGVAVRSSS